MVTLMMVTTMVMITAKATTILTRCPCALMCFPRQVVELRRQVEALERDEKALYRSKSIHRFKYSSKFGFKNLNPTCSSWQVVELRRQVETLERDEKAAREGERQLTQQLQAKDDEVKHTAF
jgi:hypothetical protein